MIITRDDVFKFICYFATPHEGAYKIGTGIFMCSPSRGTRSYGWIVTASHVARATNSTTEIYMSDENGKTIFRKLSAFGDVNKWKHHPVADISIFPIFFDDTNRAVLHHRFITIDHFFLDKKAISRDCELTVVGFPMGIGADVNFTPITVRTYPASGLLQHARLDTDGITSEFFCLENPGAKGCSGAPVMDLGYAVGGGEIIRKKEKSMICGILHGTLSDTTGGKIALVTPTYYLNDLIPPAKNK